MSVAAKKKPSHSIQRRDNIEGYLFTLPAVIGLFVFILIPIVASIVLSFTKWDLITDIEFIGIANYQELFGDEIFITSLLNTLKWVVLYIPLGLTLSFVLALAMDMPVKGIGIFRTIFYLPYVSPMLVIALLFTWMYNTDFGIINYALNQIGLPSVPWLSDGNLAIFSICIMSVWKGAGYNMLIFLAALQGIPDSLYEAADLDGITPFQKVIYIKIPLITPSLYYVMIMSVINAFQVFNEIYIMTSGGPGYSTYTMSYYLWSNAFSYNRFGYACSMAIIMFIIILAVSLFQTQFLGKKVQYDL